MKKGQRLTGTVEKIDFPNKGIVVTPDGNCIVKNALPGQTISFSVNKIRKGKTEGRLIEVLEKSPLETGSPCSHFGSCGGCVYISLPYEEQLQIKEKQVKDLLDSVLLTRQERWTWGGIKGSPHEYEYRNKMEFTFGDEYKDGPLALGMHKRGSFYDIVNVSDCKIMDSDYRNILTLTRNHFKDVSFYHRLTHKGYLRHLLVRKALNTGDILVALVTSSQEEPALDAYVQALLNLSLTGKITGILHIVNDSVADVVKSDITKVLYGQDFFNEKLLGLTFQVSPFSFFQTNSYGAEVLYETVREYIGDISNDGKADKTVYDLYSGTGTIAQLLAPVAKKVIGVEIIEEAVAAATENARKNELTNCEFIAGDVLKVLDHIAEKPDYIILDPPRDGIHPKALKKIVEYGVERMVYISCKPTSLIRDLEVFFDAGYEVTKAVAVDMFPWTGNVEIVCLLTKIGRN